MCGSGIFMNSALYGELSVIGTCGCEQFLKKVDSYLREWRGSDSSFITVPECKRFGSGEAKAMLHDSLRGYDVYIVADMYNYGVKYRMYGAEYPMSPDDHFQDLKRIINAIAGKARRISVVMPMMYESRQDKRHMRESLDCAMALQELENMGVSNILTFDVHNIGVQNAIPLIGFDNIPSTGLPRIDLTTIEQPKRDMAVQAVDMLRDKIENGTQGYVHQILLPALIKRGTCRVLE